MNGVHQYINVFGKPACVWFTNTEGRFQTTYTTLFNGIICYGAQIRVIWVPVDHTWKQTWTKCAYDLRVHIAIVSCTIQLFMHVYLHAQISVDVGYFDHRQTQMPPHWVLKQKKKMAQGLTDSGGGGWGGGGSDLNYLIMEKRCATRQIVSPYRATGLNKLQTSKTTISW